MKRRRPGKRKYDLIARRGGQKDLSCLILCEEGRKEGRKEGRRLNSVVIKFVSCWTGKI